MSIKGIMTKIANTADSFYHYILPNPAKEYAKSSLISGAYATKDLTLNNLLPSLKFMGASLKGIWAKIKALYTSLTQPKHLSKEQKAEDSKYLQLSCQQLDAAKIQAHEAAVEIIMNLGNAGCHAGNGLLNGTCLAAIGAIEAGKYIAPRAINALNFGLLKAQGAYSQLPSVTQVKSSIATSYYLLGFTFYKALNSEKSVEMVTFKSAALSL